MPYLHSFLITHKIMPSYETNKFGPTSQIGTVWRELRTVTYSPTSVPCCNRVTRVGNCRLYCGMRYNINPIQLLSTNQSDCSIWPANRYLNSEPSLRQSATHASLALLPRTCHSTQQYLPCNCCRSNRTRTHEMEEDSLLFLDTA
jgi:hypothetical protein